MFPNQRKKALEIYLEFKVNLIWEPLVSKWYWTMLANVTKFIDYYTSEKHLLFSQYYTSEKNTSSSRITTLAKNTNHR